MKYNISYSCISDIGKCRSVNQDNFICDGKYMGLEPERFSAPIIGSLTSKRPVLVGIFDGMGGEERGEIAAFIAAKEAARVAIGDEPGADLRSFCHKANYDICQYAKTYGVRAMGTTAALLAFSPREITLCNIGDSRIFRFADTKLEQISTDHVAVAAYGMKPPLSQYLGIPPEEMVIEPYMAQGKYHEGDIYLMCSDGLTDMLSQEEITHILIKSSFNDMASKLLEQAMENGGKDNITILLCRIERVHARRFGRQRKTKSR